MSARLIFHDAIVEALEADAWQITHDPYRIALGSGPACFDLGALQGGSLGAEKEDLRIVALIMETEPSGVSPVKDLQSLLGQYFLFRLALQQVDPARLLYMTVFEDVYDY